MVFDVTQCAHFGPWCSLRAKWVLTVLWLLFPSLFPLSARYPHTAEVKPRLVPWHVLCSTPQTDLRRWPDGECKLELVYGSVCLWLIPSKDIHNHFHVSRRGRKLPRAREQEAGYAFTISTCGLSFRLASTLSKPMALSQSSAFISLFGKDLITTPYLFLSQRLESW